MALSPTAMLYQQEFWKGIEMTATLPSVSRSVTSAKVTEVERILLVVPFVERVRREMERARIHAWS